MSSQQLTEMIILEEELQQQLNHNREQIKQLVKEKTKLIKSLKEIKFKIQVAHDRINKSLDITSRNSK